VAVRLTERQEFDRTTLASWRKARRRTLHRASGACTFRGFRSFARGCLALEAERDDPQWVATVGRGANRVGWWLNRVTHSGSRHGS